MLNDDVVENKGLFVEQFSANDERHLYKTKKLIGIRLDPHCKETEMPAKS